MPRALVVADDLTGATDTAHAFAKRGYETAVQISPEGDPPETTVRAVNTDSRYADPETARRRVRETIRTVSRTDTPIVYKKVDSTLRGNIVPEISGALDCGFDRALVAPASPAIRRITASGYHLVDGRLLSATEYADDPNGPESACLPTVVEKVDLTAHLGIETVAAGPEAIRTALADSSGVVFTCDVTHDRHLRSLARAAESIEGRSLFVGSSGFAEHVEVSKKPNREPYRTTAEGAAFGIVGSVSERSLNQLSALPKEWVIALDPAELLDNPERAGIKAGRRATERLEIGEHAVLTAAPNREAVERTIEIGRDADLDGEAIRSRVARALASAGRAGFEGDPAGLFVTGGDVAMAVFDRLEAGSLSLSGVEVEAGIPVSYLDGGIADGTPVITKAGGFGHEETVVNCLDFLGGSNE